MAVTTRATKAAAASEAAAASLCNVTLAAAAADSASVVDATIGNSKIELLTGIFLHVTFHLITLGCVYPAQLRYTAVRARTH